MSQPATVWVRGRESFAILARQLSDDDQLRPCSAAKNSRATSVRTRASLRRAAQRPPEGQLLYWSPRGVGHLKPKRADVTIDNPDGAPRRATSSKSRWRGAVPQPLLELGQRVQTAAEQCPHLLGGHRSRRLQSVDPVHA